MKKTVCFIFVLIIALLCSCKNNTNVWKDTHKVLGDGTYQIFNHKRNGININGISNNKYHQCIVDEIIAMKKTEQNIYIYGKFTEHDVYTTINLNNNKVKYFVVIEQDDVLGMTNINDLINSGTFEMLKSYDDFNVTEKEIFDILKVKK